MDNLEIFKGLASLGGRHRSTRLRAVLREQEQALSELPARPDAEPSLGAYIPSALISTEKRLAALAIGGAPAWSRRISSPSRALTWGNALNLVTPGSALRAAPD